MSVIRTSITVGHIMKLFKGTAPAYADKKIDQS